MPIVETLRRGARFVPTTRALARLVGAGAAAGVAAAAFWEVLLAAFWLYALGVWGAHAAAGTALVALVLHRPPAGVAR
ncbi:hypothetical protein PYV61_11830, partial [Roseisolibacter sp. H3M3-2]